MGAGPEHLLRNGLEDELRADGHELRVSSIEAQRPFHAEIATAFELYGALSRRVREVQAGGQFPLVLSGNCGSALGTVAGANPERLGIVWFDGHGDFNTPETTSSGFLDGMVLATAAGLCWRKMSASIPHFRPIAGDEIVHVGGRDFDPEERGLLEANGVAIVDAKSIRASGPLQALESAMETLSRKVSRLYLHFDLDVLDPEIAPANQYAPRDGLSVAAVREAITMIGERFTISAAGLAAYDPSYDREDRICRAGVQIASDIVASERSLQS
jgi:arginase